MQLISFLICVSPFFICIWVINLYIKKFFIGNIFLVGFPEPPGGEPTASEFTDHSLVLSWYGSMYDGGSVVTGYQVEMCTLPDKKYKEIYL